MTRILACSVLSAALVTACAGDNPKPATSKTWQHSTLSPATMATANRTTAAYHACVTSKINEFREVEMDSKASTNAIMKQCDPELNPIKDAFAAENVPPSITDRYIRRKRTQATRKVLQAMMSLHAMRYSEQQESKIR